MEKTNKGEKKLFIRGFVCIISVCIVIFVMLSVYMTSQTEKTVSEVSDIYLKEISKQVQEKFYSVIDLRLEQLNGVYKRTPPKSENSREERLEELRISAEVRGFSALGFLSEAGDYETIYGERVTLNNKDQAIASLKNDGKLITSGYDADGKACLLIGIGAGYAMSNGDESISLIAAIPMEYLNDALFLESKETKMHFHIIDRDGKMIVEDPEVANGNYYSYLLAGYNSSDDDPEKELIKDMRDKIADADDFYFPLNHNKEEKYIYTTMLIGDYDDLDWYLVSVMPKTLLSGTITKMDTERTIATILSLIVITIVMIFLFLTYYKLNARQLALLAEARKDAEQANQAKSEFLSSMSHDIRTPMNAIIGMTEIGMRNTHDPDRILDCLKKITLSSKHLLGLINDVLDMSKIESGKMVLSEHSTSLKHLMEDVVNMIQPQLKEKNHHFDIFISDIISEDVIADSVRLNQIIINLLSNAVKYTPEDGKIYVYMNQEASPKGDDYVRTNFIVKDTGIGMSEEFQKKVFETFSRENTEYIQQITGTGLGLAITKSIVDIMDGNIELHSELNKGSEFHVTLDFLKSNVKECDMVLPDWNVLVVDDHEQLCSSAVSNLEELGVKAEWATDGNTALQMVIDRHNENKDYNFVLVDWKMPQMDGIELIRQIRSKVDKNISIFLISAYAWTDVEQELNSEFFEGFIPKPLFKSTLYEHLGQYAGEQEKVVMTAQENNVDFTGKRVLMAEDVDINWEIVNEIMSDYGLELEHAENGQKCVEMMKASEVGYYDAILMDIRMPVMNGYEATRAIRRLGRADSKIPIIALTANAFSNEIQECMDNGMDGYLAKPIDVQKCLRMLSRFLT